MTGPQPDREQSASRRGRLRIYFASSSSAGTTFAMLAAGRRLKEEGCDVIVGVAQTHRRRETAALLEGLEVLPPRIFSTRGNAIVDFDLDAALARRPAVMLVDELAHANAPGSRHPKRWQDVEELLAAGIDVYTTLGVQHLDSLSDVVRSITNLTVSETIPDTVFDVADEIVLIDVPAEEVIRRLGSGDGHTAVSSKHAAEKHTAEKHTAESVISKGNLLALRELALRRTADRVEEDVQAYRADKSIEPVWKTAAALLACVGPDEGAERVVRAAARLARQLNAVWHAVYVETPSLQRLPDARREAILATLSLAQNLGATTVVISSPYVAESMVAHARKHNLSKLVIGRDPGRRLWPWQRSSGQRLALLAPDIDLIQIGAARRSASGSWIRPAADAAPDAQRARHAMRYLWAALACAAVTVVSLPLTLRFDRANIVAIYLMTVVLVGMRLGRGPAALAAVLCVSAFDFFFVPPRFSFAVSDVQYFLTFAIMLAVGLIAGQLTARLRSQARVALHREERAAALYGMARDLAGAVQLAQVARISEESVERTFHASAALLLPDASGQLVQPSVKADPALCIDQGIAKWAFDNGRPAGADTDTLPGGDVLYIPVRAPVQARGVLALRPRSRRLLKIPEQRRLLDTFAALIAIALERVHYVRLAQDALVRMESERLRNSLLEALSHDLRTPITVLLGLAESLTLTRPPLSGAQLDAAEAIQDEARRMATLVGNLLEMARIESGEARLDLQWQPLEEVVGAALESTRRILKGHRVEVRLPADLPLVRFDAVLIERVLVNLLENAAKYTPAGSHVWLAAKVEGELLEVSVSDDGPGLPKGREEALFQKFARGDRESATPGVGLGLAICRAIIESHHGKIVGINRPSGGTTFSFKLPIGRPPLAAAEIEAEVADG